ncbi:MAG TPA: hypothetical protein VHM70_00170 [Polyangiaceae bacterium]|jgi:hypothetical protein|nr:hypothetical protein [Polyangiaceae bacterium]
MPKFVESSFREPGAAENGLGVQHWEPLIRHFAALLVHIGKEFGERPLVLPNGDFFPDRFERSHAGVTRLLSRMQEHAGMGDIPIEIALTDAAMESAESCSSGGCAPKSMSEQPAGGPRLQLADETWTLRLNSAELGHPVGLTTLLVRALSLVFLEETWTPGVPPPEPIEISQDLTGVLLGFGPLLLEGSHIYSKGCGGPQISQLTALNPAELALATALFAEMRGHSLKPALKTASATQREALEIAADLVRGNRHVAQALARAPETVVKGRLELKAAKTALFGFLSRKPAASTDDDWEPALLDAPRAPVRPKALPARTRPEDDELRALVESSLQELRRES